MQKYFQLDNYTIHFKMLGTATGGFNSRYASREVTEKNLADLAQSFNSTSVTLMLPQCHSDIIHVKPGMKEAAGDVLITDIPYHALMIRPADCIPLILFSNVSPIIALVHGSRQGLEEGIIEKSIDELKAAGIAAADIQAYVGPSIQKESYMLPTKFTDKLKHPTWRHTILRQGNDAMVDITGFAKLELQRLGLSSEAINVSSIDTAKDRSYYSHYRSTNLGEPNGRNGAVVVVCPASFPLNV